MSLGKAGGDARPDPLGSRKHFHSIAFIRVIEVIGVASGNPVVVETPTVILQSTQRWLNLNARRERATRSWVLEKGRP